VSGWEDSNKSFLQAPLVKLLPSLRYRQYSISPGDVSIHHFEKCVPFRISENRIFLFLLN